MRSILERLGLAPAPSRSAETATPAAVERIAERLEGMGTERARFLAALAMVLARVAGADLEVTGTERQAIVGLLVDDGAMSREQAELVVDMVVHRHHFSGVADEYLATRELKRIATRAELEHALHALFAVSAADDSISLVEEEEVRQVASELGFSHQEYVAVRAEFRDKREVLRGLGGRPDEGR
jgi:tellurite resistance protein